MHRINKGVHVLGRCELRDAMSQIEDVAGIAGTVAVEDLPGFGGNLVGRGKQYVGIEIALQGDLVADTPARFAKSDSVICCTSRVAFTAAPTPCATFNAVLAVLAKSLAVRTTANAVPSAEVPDDFARVAIPCLR